MYLVYLVLVVLIVIYVASYYRYPNYTTILHTSLDKFTPQMLLERQPIIIDNNDCDLETIRTHWFGINFTNPYFLICSDSWHRNNYKYNIIQSLEQSTEVFICNPRTTLDIDGAPIESPETNIIGINLSIGQIVILPFHWNYIIPGDNAMNMNMKVKCLGINDLVTSIL
jgi:hypothetical protein